MPKYLFTFQMITQKIATSVLPIGPNCTLLNPRGTVHAWNNNKDFVYHFTGQDL
jgi:hypothetical protein